MAGVFGADSTACADQGDRPQAVSNRGDAAHPLVAAMVRAVGRGDGRGAVRRAVVSSIRGSGWHEPAAGPVSILRFRHLLERHKLAEQFLQTVNEQLSAKGYLLKEGTAVDATLISAPSSTKNQSGERDPEMHQTKKGNQWHFGMKAHIGVDADSGLVHTVVGTAANVNDVTQAHALVHGKEADVFGDAGYQGIDKREEVQKLKVRWHVALRPGKRRALDKNTALGKLVDELERVKARIRARAEHPFRVIKRQFGHLKVRYRGLMKNTQQLHTLFALSNLWMMRGRLMGEARA